MSMRSLRLLKSLIFITGCDEVFNMVPGCDAACGPVIRSTMPLASRHQGTTILVHMFIQLRTRTISAV